MNKNYVLNTGGGDTFTEVSKKAKDIAKQMNTVVEFDFNGIICLVNENDTVLDWLNRDYMNAHTMDWKTVGPDCKMEYDADTQIELYTRKLNRAKERKIQEAKWRKEEQEQMDSLNNSIEGITFEIIPGKEEEYKQYAEKNSQDGYSKAVIEYSEGWAKLMQIEISKGKSVKECAEETQKGVSYVGITGFQYGCAVKGLAHFWVHGEELRKWHNKEYGVSEDKPGVVNPAVLTIST